MDEVKRKYMENVTKTNETLAKEVWYAFLEDESQREKRILEKDKKIKKEEKRMEAERLKREQEETKRKQEEMFERRLREERRRADEQLQQMQKEHEYQLKCDRQQLEMMNAEWNVKQAIIKKEMEMMKSEVTKEMAEKYKADIEALKQELIQRERNSRLVKENERKTQEEIISRWKSRLQQNYAGLEQKASKLTSEANVYEHHYDKYPKTKACIIQ